MTFCNEDGNIIASQSVDRCDLRRLLRNIVQERCTHSWRNFNPEGNLEELQQWENALRPTSIFFYFASATPGGERRLAAAATVSDAIRADFPHPGFPVLARCYIVPEYRCRGLYRRVLQHRLEFCEERFGQNLKAIHLGTSNAQVARAISHATGRWPPFVRVGAEALRVADGVCIVDAFLLFMPRYLGMLARNLLVDESSSTVAHLAEALLRMCSGMKEDQDLNAGRSFAEARAAGRFDAQGLAGIQELLCLFRSIPLIGFESPHRVSYNSEG